MAKCILMLLTFFNASAHADSISEWLKAMHTSGDLQAHGFISQAFIITSDNNVFGDSGNGGSFGFTEVGLNVLFRPLPRLQLSAQALSRRAGEGNSGDPRVDFAFADYRLFSQEANQFGIRVGRLKNPIGFYNDTRDVPFTRPSILLPESIYFDRVRNLALSADSVQLYAEASQSDFGSVTIQFGVGRPIVDDDDTELALLGALRPGKLQPEAALIGRGVYETNNKKFRIALSGLQLNIDYKPGQIDSLGRGSILFQPAYLSMQYNEERWSLTSEYALRHFEFENFNNAFLDSLNFTGESFYLQGVYRINEQWETLLRYDVLYTDRKDRSGKKFASQFGVLDYSRFAKDITTGVRWNVTTEFMLRGEYHYVNGTAWLSTLDNPVATNTSQYWNLFSIQASYRF